MRAKLSVPILSALVALWFVSGSARGQGTYVPSGSGTQAWSGYGPGYSWGAYAPGTSWGTYTPGTAWGGYVPPTPPTVTTVRPEPYTVAPGLVPQPVVPGYLPNYVLVVPSGIRWVNNGV